MFNLKTIVACIISGLLLCPLALESSFYLSSRADFVDTFPTWTSAQINLTRDLVWGDVDYDGDLDLAVGNNGHNFLYLNNDGEIAKQYSWKSAVARDTYCLAWADFDSDGDLDLAAGNRDESDALYLNNNGQLLPEPIWNSSLTEFTKAIAWGDIDNDGDLDLVAGHYDYNAVMYRNNAGTLTQTPQWTSKDLQYTNDLALVDVNNDDLLDLYLANGKIPGGAKDALFFNTGNTLPASPNWESQLPRKDAAVDFGDYDRDGDLDIAIGTMSQGIYVHDNENNNITDKSAWTAGDGNIDTYDIAWADVSGNGYLDVVLANDGFNAVYKNTGGTLEDSASWHSNNGVSSTSVAVGDYDADAAFDLAFGNDLPSGGQANDIYRNNGTIISQTSAWSTTLIDVPFDLAWNDVDSDGYKDLAVGTSGMNRVYFNNGGSLIQIAGWTSSDNVNTRALAWGDIDNDGDSDLLAGNYGGKTVYYRNNFGTLTSNPWWFSSLSTNTTSLALADMDRDGDLDLAEGNKGGPNLIYLNVGTGLSTKPAWTSNDTSQTNSLAWGDFDNDGALDLAVANSGQSVEIYHNLGTMLDTKPLWRSSSKIDTRFVGWADINGDGFTDLITDSYDGTAHVYLNKNGSFSANFDWQHSGLAARTTANALFDINGDGTMDLFESNDGAANRLYVNLKGTFRDVPSWESQSSDGSLGIGVGDMENDGDFDIAVSNSNGLIEVFKNSYADLPLLVNNPTTVKINSPSGLIESAHYFSAVAKKGDIEIKYTLKDPEGSTAKIKAEYSADGGGTWQAATRNPAGSDPTFGLSATKTGMTYKFIWDSKADNVVSPNVMFKISVYSMHESAGKIQRPYMSTYTGPFPVDSPRINPPLNLKVTDATISTLKLEWTKRVGEPVAGFQVYMNASYTDINGPFELKKVVGNVSNITIIDLADGVTYYFKVKSFDSSGLHSIYSNTAEGTTIELNLAPVLLKKIQDIEIDEDEKLLNYLDLNDYFKDELQDLAAADSDGLSFEIASSENINVWLSADELLNIEPEQDYFGYEQFTITATDSVHRTSMLVNLTINPVNDAPILNLTDGFVLYGILNEWLNFTVTANDPAEPWDVLTFSDNTTLFDIEPDTGIISFNALPWNVGTHKVTITVTDSGTPSLQDSADIIVQINKTTKPGESEPPVSILVYPITNTIITTQRPTFLWDGFDVDSPQIFYDIYIAREKSFVYELNISARVVTQVTNKSLVLPQDLTNGIKYFWTVIPHDGGSRGTCQSGIWEFLVDVSQESPEVKLVSPSNRMIINASSIRLSWSLDYEGVEQVKYYVYFDTSPIPKTVVSSSVTEPYFDITNLLDGVTYYWIIIPLAGNVLGTCISGIWSLVVNFNFVQIYGVSLYTAPFVSLKLEEQKLHDATIVNDGNNVDIFLVSISTDTLQGSVSLQSQLLTLSSISTGFLELEPFEALTISLIFEVHEPELVGLHTIQLSVTSIGAQYSDIEVSEASDISVNIGSDEGEDPDEPDDTTPGPEEDDEPSFIQINTSLNWFLILLAILIAIIIIISYSAYIYQRTRKRLKERESAEDILESKELDRAHPHVREYLAAGTVKRSRMGKLFGKAELDPKAAEAEAIREALRKGRGRYFRAEDDLQIAGRPYKAAAEEIPGKRVTERTPVGEPKARRYQPEYMSPPPARPYAVAASAVPMAARAPEDDEHIMIAAPAAELLEDDTIKRTVPSKPSAYRPEHMRISDEKPYGKAAKLLMLEQKVREGKISRRLYRELKEKYVAKPSSREAKPVAYAPDHMPIPFAKPYDSAAKESKLKQKLKEGKISKRLYDELRREYT
ncbi:MAG: VCBS repeat-containing protein [Thermoplasmata archaeon]|nr:MAG: VCBS repeat-containing protein [Thermoplasmata archaeon]